MTDAGEFTRCLLAAKAGDGEAMQRAFVAVYGELRELADAQLGRAGREQTLGSTALVHEVYLRLAGTGGEDLESRRHYFALAARAMRQILVDRARRRHAAKRGGPKPAVTLDHDPAMELDALGDELLAIESALGRLGELDERLARLVELRFFAGLPETEIATLLQVNERTVRRDWQRAKAWLQAELGG